MKKKRTRKALAKVTPVTEQKPIENTSIFADIFSCLLSQISEVNVGYTKGVVRIQVKGK